MEGGRGGEERYVIQIQMYSVYLLSSLYVIIVDLQCILIN